MCDALFVQTDDVAVDEAIPAAANAHNVDIHADGRADNGTNRRVHAGGVTAAGQHADAPDGTLFNFMHMYHTYPAGFGKNFNYIIAIFFKKVK